MAHSIIHFYVHFNISVICLVVITQVIRHHIAGGTNNGVCIVKLILIASRSSVGCFSKQHCGILKALKSFIEVSN